MVHHASAWWVTHRVGRHKVESARRSSRVFASLLCGLRSSDIVSSNSRLSPRMPRGALEVSARHRPSCKHLSISCGHPVPQHRGKDRLTTGSSRPRRATGRLVSRAGLPRSRGCELRRRRRATNYRCVSTSTTASAVILTMRRTLTAGSRMCTGLAVPSRIGPTVIPLPAATLSRL